MNDFENNKETMGVEELYNKEDKLDSDFLIIH